MKPSACKCLPGPGRVTRVFRDIAPAIVWLTLISGQTMGVTPDHEVWTAQSGWTTAGELTAGDTFAALDGQPVAIVDAVVDRRPRPIYNLEVDGTFTYFAEGVWVHNNSCDVGRQLLMHQHHALPKFLGGADNGLRVLLDQTLHAQYHAGLMMRLTDSGIRRGGMKWDDYFRANDGMLEEALNVFMDYTREFDAKHNTGLVHYVWRQVMGQ
jgi:hypothetical protein